jgi:hypothetical protein
MYCTGLRIVHDLPVWDDFTTLVLSKEKSIYNYLFSYQRRLMHHLLSPKEALAFQQTWSTYLIITSDEENIRKSLGFRKNSVFFRRLRKQINHFIIDWLEFDPIHIGQNDYFKRSNCMINRFIYKYLIQNSESAGVNSFSSSSLSSLSNPVYHMRKFIL